MMLTGLNSFSAIRRARAGLLKKLSIERHRVAGDGNPPHRQKIVYLVFTPEEIFARRQAAGFQPYTKGMEAGEVSTALGHVLERVLERHNLSRREAQVALCCTEGLTNAEIGERLFTKNLYAMIASCAGAQRDSSVSPSGGRSRTG